MRVVCLTMVLLFTLSGCSDAPIAEVQDDGPEVQVDDTTGAVRGIVVDEAIRPLSGALVTLIVGNQELQTETDENGEFVFNKIAPGTYFLNVTKLQYNFIRVPVTVVAGEDDPPMVRAQINRILEGTPQMLQQKYKGHLFCAYRMVASSTCVNDYTRLCGNVDPSCCPGGCVPQVTGVVDQREFQSSVEPGWQTIIWEMAWKASSAVTGESLGLTVSYAEREGASHWYFAEQMGQPWRVQVDVDVVMGSMSTPEQGDRIDPEGQDDLWNMVSAGEGLVVEQDLEVFQTNFLHAPAPDGWSFLDGDEDPFN